MLKVVSILLVFLVSQVSAYMIHTYHHTYRGYYRPYRSYHNYYRPHYNPYIYRIHHSSNNRYMRYYDECLFYKGGNACRNKVKKYL